MEKKKNSDNFSSRLILWECEVFRYDAATLIVRTWLKANWPLKIGEE